MSSIVLSQLQQQCMSQYKLNRTPPSQMSPCSPSGSRTSKAKSNALGPLNEQGGKTGLVAIILTPTANANFENVFGPFFDDIKIVVRVIENVPINQDPNSGTNFPRG